jgi:hypothetical protein
MSGTTKLDNSWIKTTASSNTKEHLTATGIGKEEFQKLRGLFEKNNDPVIQARSLDVQSITTVVDVGSLSNTNTPSSLVDKGEEGSTSFQPIVPPPSNKNTEEKPTTSEQEALAIQMTLVAALVGAVFECARLLISSLFK